jgi:hypothetical protein
MKSNNSTFILEMILLIVITLVLVGYYFNKLLKKSKQPVEKPTVIDADVDLILNPANAKQQVKENYSIFNKTEYSIGETTAKNIDIKLTWTNGPTFSPVTKLYFRHLVNNVKVRDDTEITDESYFISNKTNEYTFLGSLFTTSTSEAVVGENYIEMYWNSISGNNKLTTVKFDITQRDLDSTLELSKSTTISVPVQLSTSKNAFGTVTSTYTRYTIEPFFKEPVRISESDSSDNSFNIINDDGVEQEIDGVKKFYIVNALDSFFISSDPSGNNILSGDTNTFQTKTVIFGNIESVTNSSIKLNNVQDGVETCLFEPPNFETEGVNDFLDNTEFSERCQRLTPQMCESELLFFENSDFGDNTDYDIKDALENKEFKDICKKRVIYN